jgi:hypothetical protein
LTSPTWSSQKNGSKTGLRVVPMGPDRDCEPINQKFKAAGTGAQRQANVRQGHGCEFKIRIIEIRKKKVSLSTTALGVAYTEVDPIVTQFISSIMWRISVRACWIKGPFSFSIFFVLLRHIIMDKKFPTFT